MRELALINKRRQLRNSRSGCGNRYTKEQKLAIVEAHVKEHLPVDELSQEFGISNVSIWRWVRNFASGKSSLSPCGLPRKVKQVSPMSKKQSKETDSEELDRLRKENLRLSEALKMAEWMNHARIFTDVSCRIQLIIAIYNWGILHLLVEFALVDSTFKCN